MKRRYFTLDGQEIFNFTDYPWTIVQVVDIEFAEDGDWITLPGWYFTDGKTLYGGYDDYPTQEDAVKACENYIKKPWKPLSLPTWDDLTSGKYNDHKWVEGKWVHKDNLVKEGTN